MTALRYETTVDLTDSRADLEVTAHIDLSAPDLMPLHRPAPPWSVPIDPNTPLVAPRKPFIPPSMLEAE